MNKEIVIVIVGFNMSIGILCLLVNWDIINFFFRLVVYRYKNIDEFMLCIYNYCIF